jgi:hypothetical protein
MRLFRKCSSRERRGEGRGGGERRGEGEGEKREGRGPVTARRGSSN